MDGPWGDLDGLSPSAVLPWVTVQTQGHCLWLHGLETPLATHQSDQLLLQKHQKPSPGTPPRQAASCSTLAHTPTLDTTAGGPLPRAPTSREPGPHTHPPLTSHVQPAHSSGTIMVRRPSSCSCLPKVTSWGFLRHHYNIDPHPRLQHQPHPSASIRILPATLAFSQHVTPVTCRWSSLSLAAGLPALRGTWAHLVSEARPGRQV